MVETVGIHAFRAPLAILPNAWYSPSLESLHRKPLSNALDSDGLFREKKSLKDAPEFLLLVLAKLCRRRELEQKVRSQATRQDLMPKAEDLSDRNAIDPYLDPSMKDSGPRRYMVEKWTKLDPKVSNLGYLSEEEWSAHKEEWKELQPITSNLNTGQQRGQNSRFTLPLYLALLGSSMRHTILKNVDYFDWNRGSYNEIWIFSFKSEEVDEIPAESFPDHLPDTVVIRIPRTECITKDSGDYIRHDIAMHEYVRKTTGIPIAKIYDHSDGTGKLRFMFIVQNFVAGQTLLSAWPGLSKYERRMVLKDLAKVLVRLATPRFSAVEALCARQLIFSQCMDLGLFDLPDGLDRARYAVKELADDICEKTGNVPWYADDDCVEAIPLELYSPKTRRLIGLGQAYVSDPATWLSDADPFVLCHADLHGNNILVQGTKVAAILDWECARINPLSEFLGELDSDGPYLKLDNFRGWPEYIDSGIEDIDDETAQNPTASNHIQSFKDFLRALNERYTIAYQLKYYMKREAIDNGWKSLDIDLLDTKYRNRAHRDWYRTKLKVMLGQLPTMCLFGLERGPGPVRHLVSRHGAIQPFEFP